MLYRCETILRIKYCIINTLNTILTENKNYLVHVQYRVKLEIQVQYRVTGVRVSSIHHVHVSIYYLIFNIRHHIKTSVWEVKRIHPNIQQLLLKKIERDDVYFLLFSWHFTSFFWSISQNKPGWVTDLLLWQHSIQLKKHQKGLKYWHVDSYFTGFGL